MGFSTFFSKQARKPSGLFGRLIMSAIFDRGNAFLNGFMFEALAVQKDDRILEIGCGTGRMIGEMAKSAKRGYVEGIDFSDEMVAIARRKNCRSIANGQVQITEGDIDTHDYERGCFDKVCSVNTIYFWSRPEHTTGRIANVLVPGGMVVLAFEDIEQLRSRKLSAEVFRLYEVEEVRTLLIEAGFSGDIDIFTRKRGKLLFHCVVAKTPCA
ncbi:MAG: class I SAM-dependent methyltransferase [bacterium]|nr:class I SAM-dependent methyltransferase [bacterium]